MPLLGGLALATLPPTVSKSGGPGPDPTIKHLPFALLPLPLVGLDWHDTCLRCCCQDQALCTPGSWINIAINGITSALRWPVMCCLCSRHVEAQGPSW